MTSDALISIGWVFLYLLNLAFICFYILYLDRKVKQRNNLTALLGVVTPPKDKKKKKKKGCTCA